MFTQEELQLIKKAIYSYYGRIDEQTGGIHPELNKLDVVLRKLVAIERQTLITSAGR
jgi:hypothetical protein